MEDMKSLDLRSFKSWLRSNNTRSVGFAGYACYETPLLRYCSENNVSLISKCKSAWGAKYDKYVRQYEGVPGRVTGLEALKMLCEVLGYHHYSN